MSGRDAVLAAIAALAERGGDADDVLRAALAELAALYPYAAIAFVEDGELAGGPQVGADAGEIRTAPIAFGGIRVAELRVSDVGPDEVAFLERVAETVAPYCLVGWDTGGESWEP